MKDKEIRAKYPEVDLFELSQYLRKNGLNYSMTFGGTMIVEDKDVESYVWFLRNKDRLEAEKKSQGAEASAKTAQENIAKRKAMAEMLITSGFNFDGYRITKYSGYISGDDAMSVNRGYAWENVSVRDELMASLAKIRRNALRELKEAAYDLGCNAVIGVDFDYITLDPQTANLTGGTTYQPYVFCVTANGNAVIIEKIKE